MKFLSMAGVMKVSMTMRFRFSGKIRTGTLYVQKWFAGDRETIEIEIPEAEENG